MEQKHDWLERIIAVGVFILGCVIKQPMITALGVIYFIFKM